MALACLAASAMVFASSDEPAATSSPERHHIDMAGLNSPAELGYKLSRTFLSQEQWQEQVKALQTKFADWERDNEGCDIGRFLNDRFLSVALGAIGGDIEKIKKGVVWLAFYREFNQPSPHLIALALQKHRGSIGRLLNDFTWTRASSYIKNKEWRQDMADEKKVSAAPVTPEKGS